MDNLAPICATNGQTYANRCELRKAGAVAAYRGLCGPFVRPRALLAWPFAEAGHAPLAWGAGLDVDHSLAGVRIGGRAAWLRPAPDGAHSGQWWLMATSSAAFGRTVVASASFGATAAAGRWAPALDLGLGARMAWFDDAWAYEPRLMLSLMLSDLRDASSAALGVSAEFGLGRFF